MLPTAGPKGAAGWAVRWSNLCTHLMGINLWLKSSVREFVPVEISSMTH